MESDNENSVASSASSIKPHTTLTEQHHRKHRDADNDIDMESDNSDFEIIGEFPVRSTLISAELGPIKGIPTEVLLLIFSHISHKPDLVPILTVCKRWGNLIVELLWFRPALMGLQAMRGLQAVMQIPPSKTYWDYRLYIRRLNLSFIYDKVDDTFLNLFEGCSNLERLTLVNCTRITRASICAVVQGCSKLQSIDMTGVKSIDDSVFSALGQNSSRLQGLYAPGCKEVTRNGIAYIYQNCPMLKRMKISENMNILDEDIINFVENCKALIEVDVHSCANLTNHSLITLFTHLEQLREFRISQNSNITDQLFRSIPEGMVLDRLRIIDFTGCTQITDQSVELIVQAAPRLRNVVLSKCSNVTDSSLKFLSKLGKNLHYVHLGHCTHITDIGIVLLARNCHRLQYIDLACCQQLTNTCLTELAHLPRLRRIGLVKCLNITDLGIHNFVVRRGHDDTLERVHLSYCTNLGLSPILELLRSCPRLTHLSLTGIRAFLRPDILRYCREPPNDFNEHQRTLFCVFSGQGVRRLREFLLRLYQEHPEEFQRGEVPQLADIIAQLPMRGLQAQNGFQLDQEERAERFHRAVNGPALNGQLDLAAFQERFRQARDNLNNIQLGANELMDHMNAIQRPGGLFPQRENGRPGPFQQADPNDDVEIEDIESD